jgi:hypothetical protein
MVEWLCQTSKSNQPNPFRSFTMTNPVSVTPAVAPAVVPSFAVFAQELIDLGKAPSQRQLETVLEGKSIEQVIALDSQGAQFTGSLERAVAAAINKALADDCAEAGRHWSEVKHTESGALAKALRPLKKACFTAWKTQRHTNPSTKWLRIGAYGYELANPKVTGDIIPEEGAEGEGAPAVGTTSRTRDLYQRSVVELAKLYRALNSAENDAAIKAHVKGEELQAALLHITNALSALDVPLEDEELVAYVKAINV